MKNILNWFQEGYSCEGCPCAWEEHGPEDYDGGCLIRDYNEPCYVPYPLRLLLLRRARYFSDHQYDGIIESYERMDEEDEKVKTAIRDMLGCCEICFKDNDGNFIPCNTESIIDHSAYRIRDACAPEYQPPPTLRQRWAALLKETLLWIPNQIKPFVCK